MELSRIGSDFFRPDIQVRGLVVEQVYHLELGRSPPRVQTELQDEYLIAFPSESLIIGKVMFCFEINRGMAIAYTAKIFCSRDFKKRRRTIVLAYLNPKILNLGL